MSRAASLPGAELFPENRRFFEETTCPGQLRCQGQNFFSKIGLLLGQAASSKKNGFLRKNMPQAAKLPRTSGFFKKSLISEKKVLPQAAKLPGTNGFFKKSQISEKKICPRQRSCPGQVASSKKSISEKKCFAPGSEASRDKWVLQRKSNF